MEQIDIMNKMLFTFKNIEVGITDLDEWFFKKHNSSLVCENGQPIKDVIFWLPLMEIKFIEFQEKLKIALTAIDKEFLAETFPFRDLICTALHSRSQYWVSLAIEWLKYIKNLREYKDCLSAIPDFEKYSQKVRHELLRFSNYAQK